MDFTTHKAKPQDLISATTLHSMGQVTIISGSHQVQGDFTKWNVYVYPGCYFYIPGDDFAYRIADILDARNLDLNVPYEGDSHYSCNYIIFRKAKEWFSCSPDKKVIQADGQDAVTLSGLPVGTILHISCQSQNIHKKWIVSESDFRFFTELPGTYNLTLKKPGYHTRQLLVEAL